MYDAASAAHIVAEDNMYSAAIDAIEGFFILNFSNLNLPKEEDARAAELINNLGLTAS